MKKRMQAILCVTMLGAVLILAGCSQAAPGDGAKADGDAGASTRMVTDAYGREVTLPQEVQSAATVGSAARFVVYAGGQDKLVAVTEMETEPGMNRPYTMAFADLFRSLPSTSNGNHLMETNVNVEELMSIDPDVIISSRSSEECDQLQEQSGIPVIGISYQNQLFSDDVYASLRCTGETLGTAEHADGVIAKLREWHDDLSSRAAEARAADPESIPTAYIGAVNYKGAKSWGGTYAHYAPAEAAGVNNVADATGQNGAVDVSLEQIAQWDPDMMFLNAGNLDLLRAEYNENQAFFQGLRAFQTDSLYTQPFYNFNGTNVDTGVCDAYLIAAMAYPDSYADVDLGAKYAEIYEVMLDGFDFYGLMREAGMGFGRFPALA